MNQQLSKNFTSNEFECHGENCCDHSWVVDPELLRGLQLVRDFIKKPLVVTRGFSCRKHNKDIGGASESSHLYGLAADLAIPEGMTVQELADICDQFRPFHVGGIGLYNDHIHVDVRRYGPARWDYR